MAHSSWGSGWPNCQTSKLQTFKAGGRSWTTRREVVPIFKHFIDEIVARGYRISDGQLDDWSFNCRAIAGTNTPSNHSYGLAVDINSLANPMTFNGRLVTDMPQWVVVAATNHGLVWGGHYSGRKKDPMHFEWTKSVADAAIMAARIGVNPPPPNQLRLTVSEFTELKSALDAIRGDVWHLTATANALRGDMLNVGLRVIALERSVHGVDDDTRDSSIYWNSRYLRGELLADEASKIRHILNTYGAAAEESARSAAQSADEAAQSADEAAESANEAT